jgi:tRNA (guanine-N7-)-methyltransferase
MVDQNIPFTWSLVSFLAQVFALHGLYDDAKHMLDRYAQENLFDSMELAKRQNKKTQRNKVEHKRHAKQQKTDEEYVKMRRADNDKLIMRVKDFLGSHHTRQKMLTDTTTTAGNKTKKKLSTFERRKLKKQQKQQQQAGKSANDPAAAANTANTANSSTIKGGSLDLNIRTEANVRVYFDLPEPVEDQEEEEEEEEEQDELLISQQPLYHLLPKSSRKPGARNDFKYKTRALEICSGHGDWIVSRCHSEPEVQWHALEMRFDRIYQTWAKARLERIPDNLFLINGEALDVVQNHMPVESFDKIYINHPDPPVTIQSSSLLITAPFLQHVISRLKAQGELIILTDDQLYAVMITEAFADAKVAETVVSLAPKQAAFVMEIPEDYGSSYFDWFGQRKGYHKRFYFHYRLK